MHSALPYCYGGTSLKRCSRTRKTSEENATPPFELDDEFRNFMPPLTPEEFEVLESGILRDGLLHSMVVWKEKGLLVDGYNRLKICRKHKIACKIHKMSFKSREMVKLWMLENQSGRRNMNPFQRIEAVLKLKDTIASQAKMNQRAAGGAVNLKKGKALQSINTDKILGEKAGVSPDIIRKATHILKWEARGIVDAADMVALRKYEVRVSAIFEKYKDHPDAVSESKIDKKSTASKKSSPVSKVKAKLSKDFENRANEVFHPLEKSIPKLFPQAEDRMHVYKRIVAWAKKEAALLQKKKIRPSE